MEVLPTPTRSVHGMLHSGKLTYPSRAYGYLPAVSHIFLRLSFSPAKLILNSVSIPPITSGLRLPRPPTFVDECKNYLLFPAQTILHVVAILRRVDECRRL
jgi:hypothetical protein